MDRDEIEELLQCADEAYTFVLALQARGRDDPAAIEGLGKVVDSRRAFADWLATYPATPRRDAAFGHLVRSYFHTSFTTRDLTHEGTTLQTSVRVVRASATLSVPRMKRDALRWLAGRHGVRLDGAQLRRLASSGGPELDLWTWIWGIRQRSRGKDKGGGMHRVWRSLDAETRRSLDANRVERAIAVLVDRLKPLQ